MSSAASPTARCSMCKQPTPPDQPGFRCSVAACNAGRVRLRFCSVACFERHIPTARHRKASCIPEAAAPLEPR
jgi:hypothetical protein